MSRLSFFLCALTCFCQIAFGASHETVYVSSSIGTFDSDGHDPDHPTSNLSFAVKSAKTVLLKAGDTFYQGYLNVSGIKLSRYGEGSNPLICGFKHIVGCRWIEDSPNIWVLDMLSDGFSGFVTNGPSLSNDICAFHDRDADLIHGRKVWKKDEMNADWDFWQTDDLSHRNPESYNRLYLYLSSDPNLLDLELSVYDTALIVRNSTVDGVSFIGFGFGISAGTNTIIRNCLIDAIGGRIIKEGNSYNCYGNGIEFFVSSDISDCIVEDCRISRCYDCAATIQGSRGCKGSPKNIVFRNNLITNCCQGWEDCLNNNKDVVFDDCVFCNNIVLRSGNTTGFGYQKSRFKFCHVLGNNVVGNKGMQIRDNVFVGGNFYCSGVYDDAYRSNLWSGNECYLSSGDYVLGEYFGRKDVLKVGWSKLFSSREFRVYRKLTGDETTVFHIYPQRRLDNKASNLEQEFMNTHQY